MLGEKDGAVMQWRFMLAAPENGGGGIQGPQPGSTSEQLNPNPCLGGVGGGNQRAEACEGSSADSNCTAEFENPWCMGHIRRKAFSVSTGAPLYPWNSRIMEPMRLTTVFHILWVFLQKNTRRTTELENPQGLLYSTQGPFSWDARGVSQDIYGT